MKVKVLKNQLQSHIEGALFNLRMKQEPLKDGEDEIKILHRVIGSNLEQITPVFNRVGFYKTNDMCWYEFKLPSGRIVAALYRGDMFNYYLKDLISKEKAVNSDHWEMIQTLIKKGVIDNSERWRLEGKRRYQVLQYRIGVLRWKLNLTKKMEAINVKNKNKTNSEAS